MVIDSFALHALDRDCPKTYESLATTNRQFEGLHQHVIWYGRWDIQAIKNSKTKKKKWP